MLSELVEAVQQQAKQSYNKIKGIFVTSPDQLLANSGNVLNGLSEYDNQIEDYEPASHVKNFKSADHRDIINSFQSPKKDHLKPEVSVDYQRKGNRPGSSSSQVYSGLSKFSRLKEQPSASELRKNNPRNYHMGNLKSQQPGSFAVTVDQQNITSQWLQDFSMKEIGEINLQNHTSEALLCCVFACQGSMIVVGSKDKKIRVYEVSSGNLIHTL